MTEAIKILTSNWHVPYIYNLAKLKQYQFDVISFRNKLAGRDWYQGYRTIPDNVHHIAIDSPQWLELINQQKYNLVIMHSVYDIDAFEKVNAPKVMVFHNSFFTEFRNIHPSQFAEQRLQVKQKLIRANIKPIFISQWKQQSWELDGIIVNPGIDTVSEFPYSYQGIEPKILRACSNFKHRDFMNGYIISNQCCTGFYNILLGEGNNLNDFQKEFTQLGQSQNFEQLKAIYSNLRLFCSTNIDNYEDSYNLASLEAAAIGMPIIAFSHSSSIWQDGIHGAVSDDIGYLRLRIQQFLQDRQESIEKGKQARQLILQLFPLSLFLNNWSNVILSLSLSKKNIIHFSHLK